MALLGREKKLTRLRDEIAAERRRLPWVRLDKQYEFDGPDGRVAMRDLFDGHSQLIVYHFMFGPGWGEGCPLCSFRADSFNAMPEYNFRHVDEPMEESPGLSVFATNDEGEIFHTYSTYSRGLDPVNSGYQLLDLTPKGRDEEDLPWRRHVQGQAVQQPGSTDEKSPLGAAGRL